MFGILPVFLSFIGLIFWVIVKITCRRNSSTFNMKQYIVTTTFAFIFIVYPQITSISFSLLNCVPYEDGFSYLKNDMSVKCWHGNHIKMVLALGIPFILLWSIVFPLFILWRLYKGKKYLNTPYYLITYGLFYVGLSDQAFFWELVVVNLRKIIFIVCGSTISSSNDQYKVSPAVLTSLGLDRHRSPFLPGSVLPLQGPLHWPQV